MNIIRFSLLLSLLIVFNESPAQDTIHWSPSHKLKWEDFKGKPDTTSEYRAITVADIECILSYNVYSFSVKVSCTVDRRKSWTNSNDSLGLAHEQGHFDIAEIFARKLRKAFKEYIFNPKTIEADYNRIFTRIKADRKAFNALYDKETNFSRNRQKQLYWSNRIRAELKKLEAYRE